MIDHLDITGVHTEVDEALSKYVSKKIGRLDRFMKRHDRASAHAEVKLKESRAKDKKQCTCEVIVHVAGERITVSESTINMYAAVDIVEAKLKNQLKKFKEKRQSPKSGHKESAVRKALGKILSK